MAVAPAKGSPAPLIIFIVLFVFSAVALVIVGMELSKASTECDRLNSKLQNEKNNWLALQEAFDKYHKRVGVIEYKELGAQMRGWAQKLGEVEEGKEVSLLALMQLQEEQKQKLERELEREKDARQQETEKRRADREKADELLKQKDAAITEHVQKIDGLRTQLESAREKMTSQSQKDKDEIQRLMRQLDILRRELIAARAQTTRGGEGSMYKAEAEPADGQVILVDRHTGVVLDIGKKEVVRSGLRFRVFRQHPDGTREECGEIEVKTVQDTISRAVLVGGADPVGTVKKGDIVVNPAFHPGRASIFVADDSFDEAKKQAFRELLGRYGSVLEDKITIRTDYLIVGGQRTKAWDQAERYNIPMIRAGDLSAYLGR